MFLQSAIAYLITKCDGLLLQNATAFLLQSATAYFITKCDGLLLQNATAFLLQSATSVITKCDGYYEVRQNKVSFISGKAEKSCGVEEWYFNKEPPGVPQFYTVHRSREEI